MDSTIVYLLQNRNFKSFAYGLDHFRGIYIIVFILVKAIKPTRQRRI